MKIPDIGIQNSGVWHNSRKHRKSAKRFVVKYEFEFRKKITGETTVNNVVYPARVNTFIFCRPGDIRHSLFDTDYSTEIEYVYFNISPEEDIGLEKMLSMIPTYIVPDEATIKRWEKLLCLIGNRKSQFDDMRAHLVLLLMLTDLSELSTGSLPPVTHSPQQRAIFEAIRFMNDHLTENLSVTEMAEHIKYSPSRFNAIFKELTGCAPHAYYISLKITESRDMLLNTNMSIAEISDALAFGKASNFGAAFKKICRMTPSEFRKNREALFYE